ncbi:hypothetical protein [Actinomyces lilanjuaniae]|uniref:response regulator transcription factor n=1 Tax=Actinomyces lilanjuaniae TaxID=2321394 RepID=UPI00311AA09E
MSSQSSSSAIRVAVVDDDAMALTYLRSCLLADVGIQVLATTRSADQALAFLRAHTVDVLITSLHGDAKDPVEGTAMIREVLRASPGPASSSWLPRTPTPPCYRAWRRAPAASCSRPRRQRRSSPRSASRTPGEGRHPGAHATSH